MIDDLVRQVNNASRAWPDVELDSSEVAEFFWTRVQRRSRQKGLSIPEAIEGLHCVDLYLACGCAKTNVAALRAFERTLGAEVERIARRFESRFMAASDLKQMLREKLFVAGLGEHPKIESYSGFGSLKAWLRVTATRTFLDETRRLNGRKGGWWSTPEIEDIPDSLDVELSVLKEEYRESFKRALIAAVRELSPRERNLLRQRFMSGLSVQQLAAVYGVHRTTMSRRLSRARRALYSMTRRIFAQEIGLDSVGSDEFESAIELVMSGLDICVHQLFASMAGSRSPTSGGRVP